MIPISYNVRNLVVRRTTTIAAVFGIGLATWALGSALMLNNGITRTLATSGRPDNVIVLRQGSDAELSSTVVDNQVGLLRARDGVARTSAGEPLGVGEVVVVVTQPKKGTDGGVSNVTVRGTMENVWDFRPEVRIIAGRRPKPGTNEVAIGKAIRGRFEGVDLGETFNLKKNRPVTVVGIFESDGSSFESEVWCDLDALRAAFGRMGRVSSVRLRLVSPTKFDAFKNDVETDKTLGLQVTRETTYYEKLSEGTTAFILGLGIVIAVFFALGAVIGAAITMHAQVANRTREIGTLRALGFSRFSILTSFVFEAFLVAGVGGLVGLLASLVMTFARVSTLNFATWSEMVFRFETTPKIMLGSLIFALAMGFIGGVFPAIRAARMSPLQAIRDA
jgi:putative ABC transport system permease protein